RSQERQEPGDEIPRAPRESAPRTDAAAREGGHVLLRFAQRERQETGGEPGTLDEEKENPRARGRLPPHEPARDWTERQARGPAEEIEEGQEPEGDGRRRGDRRAPAAS